MRTDYTAERPGVVVRDPPPAPPAVPPDPVKILFLSHRPPWPLHDGYNLHNHHYVRQLHGRHDVHLVAVGQDVLPPESRACYRSVTCVPERRPPRATGLARLTSALSVDHVFDHDPAVVDAIARVVAAHGPFDLVWTSGAKMLPYSRDLTTLPVLGDIADEALGEAVYDLFHPDGPVDALRRLKNVVNTWRFQRRYLAHTPIVTVVSENDRRWLGRHVKGIDVRVCPNGVDAERFSPQGGEQVPASLVFEGAMGFPPNAEGIVSFVRETLPLIRERRPDVTLTVVGREPSPEVAALAGPGVEVTGFVDDVRPYVDRAAVFVCPLRRGAGIKNKILQAWAMEKAVVATPISCGGLRIDDGGNLVVAESPRELADACLALFDDPERRARLGRAGRATVQAHSSWEAAAARMEAILGELTGAGLRR